MKHYYEVWGENNPDGWGIIGEYDTLKDAINLKYELSDEYSQFKIVERNELSI